VPSCKISSKSAKRFLRYRDFSIFKMAAVRHLDFEICKFLVSHQVERSKMHHYTKFHQNRSTAAEMLRSTFFTMAAVRHLGFFKN